MLLKSRFVGIWKHHLWKKNFGDFTVLKQRQQFHYSNIVTPNNILINNLANAGKVEVARSLFNEMPVRTVVSWNSMICGYSKQRRFNEALMLASTMHHFDVKMNETTFSKLLSVCAHSKSIHVGKQVHCLVLKLCFESFKVVGSALLYFYASCCKIGEAKTVFNELHAGNEFLWSVMLVGYVQCNLMSDALEVFVKMPDRDLVAWTTLISGYAKSESECWRALDLFGDMRRISSVSPNEFTLDCVIRACGRVGVMQEGMGVHGLLIKYGFEFDDSIINALIQFYSDCEALDDAKRVYVTMGGASLNDSNSLIRGLISMGRIEEAELIYDNLTEKNAISHNLMIKGYAMNGHSKKSKRLFEKMSSKTITSTNTMISVYSRDRELGNALKLFEETKGERNSVTWNSMMSGYILNDQYKEALVLYLNMCRLSIERTRSTFSVLFHACACLGSLQQGQLLHSHLIKTPFESNIYVGTALVDMYSKCGSISDAWRSFLSVSSPNVAAWTALINGYAHNGLGTDAIKLFEHMLAQGVVPNAATLVGVLSACSHTGLVDKGMEFFLSMERCYGVTPTLEHYTCVVNLLGRSGYLKEAWEFIKEMPIEADTVIWGTLLDACWFWMDVDLGEKVAEKLHSLDPKPESAYVVLSNMFALLGKWREKIKMRTVLKTIAGKYPGCSWIELNNRVQEFLT